MTNATCVRILLPAFLLLSTALPAAAQTTISIDPPQRIDQTLEPDPNALIFTTFYVTCTGMPQTGYISFALQYDPSVLQFMTTSSSNFNLNGPWSPGYIEAAGLASTPGLSGDFKAAGLTFRVIGVGHSALTLRGPASNPGLGPIYIDDTFSELPFGSVGNGLFSNEPPPEPTPSPSPEPVTDEGGTGGGGGGGGCGGSAGIAALPGAVLILALVRQGRR